MSKYSATYPPTLQRAFLRGFCNHFGFDTAIASTVVKQTLTRTRRYKKLFTMTKDGVLDAVGVAYGAVNCASDVKALLQFFFFFLSPLKPP